jgi:hypothetical protein
MRSFADLDGLIGRVPAAVVEVRPGFRPVDSCRLQVRG